MLKTALPVVALGMLLLAIPASKAEIAPQTYFAPPPPVVVAPSGYAPLCYRTYTRRESDKGFRHWTGLCQGRWD